MKTACGKHTQLLPCLVGAPWRNLNRNSSVKCHNSFDELMECTYVQLMSKPHRVCKTRWAYPLHQICAWCCLIRKQHCGNVARIAMCYHWQQRKLARKFRVLSMKIKKVSVYHISSYAWTVYSLLKTWTYYVAMPLSVFFCAINYRRSLLLLYHYIETSSLQCRVTTNVF